MSLADDEDLVVKPSCLEPARLALIGEDPDLVAAPDPGCGGRVPRNLGGRPKVTRELGLFTALVIVSSDARRYPWGTFVPYDSYMVVGVATCRWNLTQPETDDADAFRVDYWALEYNRFRSALSWPEWRIDDKVFATSSYRADLSKLTLLDSSLQFPEFLERQQSRNLYQIVVNFQELTDLHDVWNAGEMLLRRVVVGCSKDAPIDMKEIVANNPTRHEVKSFRASMPTSPDAASMKMLLELPEGISQQYDSLEHDNSGRGVDALKKKFDPVRMINALGFALHLRSSQRFTQALQDADEYELDPSDDEAPVRDSKRDPARDTLFRARGKLDAVAMALSRRQLCTLLPSGVILGINLYSDASPVVGTELQGMVMDIMLRPGGDEEMIRRTLPGSSLAYGHTTWVDKCVALIWAVFLLVGPDLQMLYAFWQNVRSVTTDYGVELSTSLICDILPAFVVWTSGNVSIPQVSNLIRTQHRLMPKCLRIGGWSHSCGHIMEMACKVHEKWPKFLGMLRCLCRVLQNDSYRKHLGQVLKVPDVSCGKLLRSFTANFAKWRFETLFDVLRQLSPLRVISGHIKRTNFDGVQSEEEMTSFMQACQHGPLWNFIQHCFDFLIKPLEQFRRWGLLCPCHEQERRDGSKGFRHCVWNSRRLRYAKAKVESTVRWLRDQANNLTLLLVNGDAELHLNLVNALRAAAAEMETRFSYLKSLPWLYSTADTEQGARECVEQFDSVPIADHDEYTVDVMKEFGEDIRRLAQGDTPCPARWQAEVQAINTAALDESAGEGYHRSTNLAKKHGAASSIESIKQSTRTRENVKLAKTFAKKYKHAGRRVLRYEWKNFRRILQRTKAKRWTPVRMSIRKFYKRVYRMDAMAKENWGPFITQPGCIPEAIVAKETWAEELGREYLGTTLKPFRYYSFPETREVMADGGVLVQQKTTRFIQITKINKGASRTHTIPSILSRRNSEKAKFAIHVQPLTLWREGEGDGISHVFVDSEPFWCEPSALASFTTLQKQLQVSTLVLPSEAYPECQALSCFEAAKPTTALMDKDHPTVLVLAALKQLGWKQHPNGSCTHNSSNAMVRLCDSRGGPSHKPYYQCLLNVKKSLELCSGLPSNSRQSFYRCILAGKRAEASWSDRECRAALNDVDASCVAPMEAIEDGDGGVEVDGPLPIAAGGDDDGDGIIVGPSMEPVEPVKKKVCTFAKQNGFLALPDGVVVVEEKDEPGPGALPLEGPPLAPPLEPPPPLEHGDHDDDLVVAPSVPAAVPHVGKKVYIKIYVLMMGT
jgi:hypothetical protein